ncbi:unnamed protein product [Parajaminaea phylloscopi]
MKGPTYQYLNQFRNGVGCPPLDLTDHRTKHRSTHLSFARSASRLPPASPNLLRGSTPTGDACAQTRAYRRPSSPGAEGGRGSPKGLLRRTTLYHHNINFDGNMAEEERDGSPSRNQRTASPSQSTSSSSVTSAPRRVSTPSSPQILPRQHRSHSREGTRRRDSGSSSNGSRTESDEATSQARMNGSSTADPLTDSVISTFDLDVPQDAPAPASATATAPRPVETSAALPLRRAPLVREDTATRQAIESIEISPAAEHSQLPDALDGVADSREEESSSETLESGSRPARAASRSLPPTSNSIVMPSTFLSQGQSHGSTGSWGGFSSGPPPEDPAPHQPKTTATGRDDDDHHHTATIPTVSATGMPRFFPRGTEDPTRQHHSSSSAPPPPELMPEGSSTSAPWPSGRQGRRAGGRRGSSSSSASRGGSADEDAQSPDQDHDLTPMFMQALLPSSSLPLLQRLSILSSSFVLNFGLPFVNGLFLGFGEIFARSLIAPVLLGVIDSRWPHLARWKWSGNSPPTQPRSARDDQGSSTTSDKVDLARQAGSGRGIGTSGVGVRATGF